MKLVIEEEKVEKLVHLYLERSADGVVLYAKEDGTSGRKGLLAFYEDGHVKRALCAEIGDFKFDSSGRLIIE